MAGGVDVFKLAQDVRIVCVPEMRAFDVKQISAHVGCPLGGCNFESELRKEMLGQGVMSCAITIVGAVSPCERKAQKRG